MGFFVTAPGGAAGGEVRAPPRLPALLLVQRRDLLPIGPASGLGGSCRLLRRGSCRIDLPQYLSTGDLSLTASTALSAERSAAARPPTRRCRIDNRPHGAGNPQ